MVSQSGSPCRRHSLVKVFAAAAVLLSQQPWSSCFTGLSKHQILQNKNDNLLIRRRAEGGFGGGPPGLDPSLSPLSEIQQARFLGRLITWTPKLEKASTVVEAQAAMPLGIRIEKQAGVFVVTEVLSGGAAALGNLDVQEDNIIHYITTDADGGGKRIVSAEDFNSVEELSQAILANQDEQVAMLVEKPDSGVLGGVGFLTDAAGQL
mmetsp:Transcript_54571/g.130190  ORF Transcript_54571/g.130190 Transcript_54571/m.130190 type:complete len:207 (+) Transcript_54571:83-703(+)